MRRWIRGSINALLVATLVRPLLRRLIARKRQEAKHYAEATFVIPAHELLGSLLPAQLAAAPSGPPPAAEGEAGAGRSPVRIALILGAVAVLAASVSAAVVALWRRRSRARREPSVARQPVAVPVEAERAPGDAAPAGLPAKEAAASKRRQPAGSASR